MNCSCSSYETVEKACIASLLIQFDMAGMDTIQERRGQKTEKPALLNGPGKVSSILSSTFHTQHTFDWTATKQTCGIVMIQ